MSIFKKIVKNIKKYGFKTFIELEKFKKKKKRLFHLQKKIQLGLINSTELNEYYKLKEEVLKMAKKFILKDGKIVLTDEDVPEQKIEEMAKENIKYPSRQTRRKLIPEEEDINEFTMQKSSIEPETNYMKMNEEDINTQVKEERQRGDEQMLNKFMKKQNIEDESVQKSLRQQVEEQQLQTNINQQIESLMNENYQESEQFNEENLQQNVDQRNTQYQDMEYQDLAYQNTQYQDIGQQDINYQRQQRVQQYQEQELRRQQYLEEQARQVQSQVQAQSQEQVQHQVQQQVNQQQSDNLLKVFIVVEDLPELEMLIRENDVEAFVTAINEAMATGKPFLVGPFTLNGHKIIMYRFERVDETNVNTGV